MFSVLPGARNWGEKNYSNTISKNRTTTPIMYILGTFKYYRWQLVNVFSFKVQFY